MKVALLAETSREYGREFLNGLAQFAQEQGGWLLRLFSPDDLKGRHPFAGFDGIITRAFNDKAIRKLKASGLPVVDASHQTPTSEFIGVGSDDVAIASMAAAFFLERGFRNFAYCGYAGTGFSDTRAAAFRAAVAKHGFKVLKYTKHEPMDDDIIFDERMGQDAPDKSLRQWIKTLPSGTAVFCANDMRANQICKIAGEDGVRVPQDLSLLGVDNDSFLCLFSSTPLSSIDPNAHGVGYSAARLLLAAIQNPPPHKKRPIFRVRPGKLVERTSTAFRPISPEWLSDALVFIDRNRFQPLSAAEVVARCNRSAHTVAKAFLKNFGLTPGRYITRMKMEEARRLVRLRTHSSKEIASLVGYTSPQYFCNAYRAYYGHSPFASSSYS